MKALRERPSQRLNHRLTAPLFVKHRGHEYEAKDWSVDHIAIKDFYPEISADRETDVAIELPFQGFDIKFNATINILRIADGITVVQFVKLPVREQELWQHLFEILLSEKMIDIGDTILRLDEPISPAPIPHVPHIEQKVSDIPAPKWNARVMLTTAFHLLTGIAVLWLYGNGHI